MSLQGKIAVVTGGSQGIGEAIALVFAKEGATIAIINNAHRDTALSVVRKIQSLGGCARSFPADLTKPSETKTAIGAILETFTTIDILVNCAGIFFKTPIEDTTEKDYDRMADLNLKGTFFCIQNVVPEMRRRQAGRIINVASVAGLFGLSGYSLYCATKASIINLTKALALELAPHGINVNCLVPGNVATPMNEELRNDPKHSKYIEHMRNRTPSGRVFLEAEDIAAAALFLASERSKGMHGSALVIDEGFAAGVG